MDRKLFGAAIVVGVLGAVLATVASPAAPRLDGRASGDPALAERVRSVIDDRKGYRSLSVALIENGQVTFAGLGDRGDGKAPQPGTPYEVGSIGKSLTGMLLADMAADGRVDPAAAVTDGGPTYEELTSHRAGLPSLKIDSVSTALRLNFNQIRGDDAYAAMDTDWMRKVAPGVEPGRKRGTVEYSNFGAALLGHSLAERAGSTYPRLLEQRILGPNGMTDTGFRLDGAAPPDGAATGSTAGGQARAPWTGSGYAPAGVGLWSTAEDLAKLLNRVLAGTAPGIGATTPRFDAGGSGRVGYGWFTTDFGDKRITWHNGGTGGFRSFYGFDPASRRGIVVLGNTTREVNSVGVRLLDGERDAGRPGDATLPMIAAALLLALGGGVSLLVAAVRSSSKDSRSAGKQRWWAPSADRLSLIGGIVWAVAGPLLANRLDVWQSLPRWLWGIGVGLSAAAVVLAVARLRSVPWRGRGNAWLRWTGLVAGTVFAGAVTLALYY